jgi:DNA-binding transcriptional LysR family regulator
MELRHLRYFVAVAEECHFGRAAERLHIAQPPLSQQIMQLETELGVRLLSRSTRKVEPTPAGASYLEHARQILAAVDLAREEASRVASGEVGRLAIGFTGSATYELLPTLARMLEGVVEQPGVLGRGEQLAAQVEQQVRQRREPLVAVLPERGR